MARQPPFPRISLIDVLRGHYVPSFFKNKVILVGVTSEGIEDNKLIPFTQHRNRIAGVEVQANILSNLLDKNALQIADERLRLSLIIVISLLGIFLFMKLGEKAATFLWVSGLIVVSASIFFLFVFRNLWISPSLFYWTISFLFVTAYLYKLDKAARQLDVKYLTLNERIGWDVKTNGKENQEKGLISFLSAGGINTKIQRLLTIVTAIINMAHTLNLRTIAEGIETEEQWKILRLLKCDMGQGFYFSKPLPAEEIERFFEQP